MRRTLGVRHLRTSEELGPSAQSLHCNGVMWRKSQGPFAPFPTHLTGIALWVPIPSFLTPGRLGDLAGLWDGARKRVRGFQGAPRWPGGTALNPAESTSTPAPPGTSGASQSPREGRSSGADKLLARSHVHVNGWLWPPGSGVRRGPGAPWNGRAQHGPSLQAAT